jgi:hypothetical protein
LKKILKKIFSIRIRPIRFLFFIKILIWNILKSILVQIEFFILFIKWFRANLFLRRLSRRARVYNRIALNLLLIFLLNFFSIFFLLFFNVLILHKWILIIFIIIFIFIFYLILIFFIFIIVFFITIILLFF